MTDIEIVGQTQFDEVISFYDREGYGGGIAPDDVVIGARTENNLVGVVRLATENGFLVLRGMFVQRDVQRQGIGLRLLAAVQEFLGDQECWCVSYSHLRDFYMMAGFAEQPRESAPAFLVARLNKYIESGKQVILMRRDRGV